VCFDRGGNLPKAGTDDRIPREARTRALSEGAWQMHEALERSNVLMCEGITCHGACTTHKETYP